MYKTILIEAFTVQIKPKRGYNQKGHKNIQQWKAIKRLNATFETTVWHVVYANFLTWSGSPSKWSRPINDQLIIQGTTRQNPFSRRTFRKVKSCETIEAMKHMYSYKLKLDIVRFRMSLEQLTYIKSQHIYIFLHSQECQFFMRLSTNHHEKSLVGCI